MLTGVSLLSESFLRQAVQQTLNQVMAFAEQQAAASVKNRPPIVRIQDMPTVFADLKPESCWKD
ncbi:MAG: hypothetical protein KDE56_01685 [Anaerolineales bacterium]|nr:hypothetical protein [Anaerolineales bacterium]